MVQYAGFHVHQQISVRFCREEKKWICFVAVSIGKNLPWPFFGWVGGGKLFVLVEKGIMFLHLINCVERILKFEYSFYTAFVSYSSPCF